MWQDLSNQNVQMDILAAAASGQSIPLCAYAGRVKPSTLYAALKAGHDEDEIWVEFASMFYQHASLAQKEVLESAKLKPDIWLTQTRDTYVALAAEHAHDLVQELEESIKED